MRSKFPGESEEPFVMLSEEMERKIENLKGTVDGLREALFLLVPVATKHAVSGNASWAKFLLDMGTKFLPECKEKRVALTPEDYYAMQRKLEDISTHNSDIKLIVQRTE